MLPLLQRRFVFSLVVSSPVRHERKKKVMVLGVIPHFRRETSFENLKRMEEEEALDLSILSSEMGRASAQLFSFASLVSSFNSAIYELSDWLVRLGNFWFGKLTRLILTIKSDESSKYQSQKKSAKR